MNWIVSLTVLCVTAAALASCAGPTASAQLAPESARQEVLAVLDAQAAAWSRGDLDAFTAVYAGDALFVTPGGVTRGRDEVLARYRKRYPSREAMGALSFEIIEARPMPGGVVTIAARWQLNRPGQEDASGYTLIVFQRIGGRWLVVQDASM